MGQNFMHWHISDLVICLFLKASSLRLHLKMTLMLKNSTGAIFMTEHSMGTKSITIQISLKK
jgi:hypothetical protein